MADAGSYEEGGDEVVTKLTDIDEPSERYEKVISMLSKKGSKESLEAFEKFKRKYPKLLDLHDSDIDTGYMMLSMATIWWCVGYNEGRNHEEDY